MWHLNLFSRTRVNRAASPESVSIALSMLWANSADNIFKYFSNVQTGFDISWILSPKQEIFAWNLDMYACFHGWMDRQMDGWTDGWLDGISKVSKNAVYWIICPACYALRETIYHHIFIFSRTFQTSIIPLLWSNMDRRQRPEKCSKINHKCHIFHSQGFLSRKPRGSIKSCITN